MPKVNMLVNVFVRIVEYPVFKLFGSGVLAILSFLFDGLLSQAMLALFILIMFDFVTAIIAVRKTPNEKIQSRKLWVTAGKLSVYFLLISAGRLSEHGTHNVIPFIDETIIGFLVLTELLSILENAGKMGYAVPKQLINRISKYRDTK